jgi:hypothetical protein
VHTTGTFPSDQVASLWQKALDQLSGIASGSAAGMDDLTDVLQQLALLPEPSAATWRSLIQDMQVSSCDEALAWISSALITHIQHIDLKACYWDVTWACCKAAGCGRPSAVHAPAVFVSA